MNRAAIRSGVIWVVVIAAFVGMFLHAPIAQPVAYHDFADGRTLFGIPNFWNVASNIPFLVVGWMGLRLVLSGKFGGGLQSLRWSYGTFFFCLMLVCFGSGFYHLDPGHSRLAMDRVPIVCAIMAVLSFTVGEQINEKLGRVMLWPLIVFGLITVWYWWHTEQQGQGDLRIYLLAQFLSLLVIAMILLMYPSRFNGKVWVWAIFLAYGFAKVIEELDKPMYAFSGHFMSGHALKHIVAGLGMGFFITALRRRTLKV